MKNPIKILNLKNLILIFIFSFTFTFSSSNKFLDQLQYQIKVNDFLGAKKLAEKLYKESSSLKEKEIGFLTYWLASGYLHYHKGSFNKILEDIGGLNLYWAVFKKKRYYEDFYYDFLGQLYFLLFQYRRAVIFFIQSYKRKPSLERYLKIILATELAYYNEIYPYKNFNFIKKLLQNVNTKKLSPFERELYNYEWGLYYLLKKDYKQALQFLVTTYDFDLPLITEGQKLFFIGKAYEGNRNYEKAFFLYKKALKVVKHPVYKANILLHLFKLSAILGKDIEANNYYLALTKFGGLEKNPYLQEATLEIYNLENFLEKFYWKKFYKNLLAEIFWLNFNKKRGKKAFQIFLEDFLKTGNLYPDFFIAWKVLYPDEIGYLKFDVKKVLQIPISKLENLYLLYINNPQLFNSLFKDYGKLTLAKFFFMKGSWNKALILVKKIKLNNPIKIYILGVIKAYKGKPYFLEIHLKDLPRQQQLEALFWIGWGYLLHNRWDLVGLYWENFLKRSGILYWERIFASYYLAFHYDSIGLENKAIQYYFLTLELLSKQSNFYGIRRWITIRLVDLGIPINNINKYTDNRWQNILKYFYRSKVK